MPSHPAIVGQSSVHPVYARLLRMLLEKADVDSVRVLASAQLEWDTLVRDEKWLERTTVVRLVQAAIAATGKPWLGLDLGWLAPISAHGEVAYAAVTAPDLGSALAVMARFGALRDDMFTWTFIPYPQGGAVLRAVQRTDWGPANGFVLDTVVAAVMRVIEASLGQWPAGVRLELPMAQPPWAAQYARVSPLEIHFGRPVLSFCFESAALKMPCIGGDAHAHANARRECEHALAKIEGLSYTQRVRNVLADAPVGCYPQLGQVAKECGVSNRTLMRHLRAEGSAFQTLLDGDRKARAHWLLVHTRLSMEELAAQLGYADTSNFSRTVRRWFGAPPREIRVAGAGRNDNFPGSDYH